MLVRLAVYLKGKNAKNFRHGREYGSARWGGAKDIGKRIKPIRRQRRMSQIALSEIIDCSPNHLSYIENGNRSMSFASFVQMRSLILDALKICAAVNKKSVPFFMYDLPSSLRIQDFHKFLPGDGLFLTQEATQLMEFCLVVRQQL